MKGILMAGGHGSRLYPLTAAISKHLLPICDKPMIYYPLSVLMLADIREVLIVTKSRDLEAYKSLFGDGSKFGMIIDYAIQDEPKGIADAFNLGRAFARESPVCLILGDNIFYGHGLPSYLKSATEELNGATVFAYRVKDPSNFGVIDYHTNGAIKAIVEKPSKPPSKYAVTGLYFYDNEVFDVVGNISPSLRGELEITDVNNYFLGLGRLSVTELGRGIAWLDTGTPNAVLTASAFINSIESQQGLKAACLEEIAYKNGWIEESHLRKLAELAPVSNYGDYLKGILCER